MNDEDENAKEVYDFFKGSGLTSEVFHNGPVYLKNSCPKKSNKSISRKNFFD